MSFLQTVWASDGCHCVVTIKNGVVRHYWDTATDLKAAVAASVRANADVYFAPATFASDSRVQNNIHSIQSFWLDVDVGINKPYATIPDALNALKHFIDLVGLPLPWMIQSGRGLHVYWPLTQPVVGTLWLPVAKRLKMVCEKARFYPGAERTADAASIMRLPGTFHHKDADNPLPVRVLKEGLSSDFLVFSRALEKFSPDDKSKAPSLTRSVNESMMAIAVTRTPSSAEVIAGKCQQLAYFRAKKGEVPEPFWYAAIQLLRFTTEAPGIIHEWSKGDPRYDEAQTNAKIAQLDVKQIGPTTCERLAVISGHGELCTKCPYYRKIPTPLQLGIQLEHAPAKAQYAALPAPFFYDAEERVGIRNPSTHVEELIYPYPLRVTARYKDGNQEFVAIECRFPQEGWQTILLPLSSLYSRNGIAEELAARGVLLDMTYIDTMAMFITECVRAHQALRKAKTLVTQLGWHAEGFAFPDCWYTPEGEQGDMFLQNRSSTLTKGFRQRGDMVAWQLVLQHYVNAPAEWQLAFLSGFAAPLMHMTGFGGLTVNLVGRTGTGKSTAQRAIAALYGDPSAIVGQKHDTPNSLMHRLGLYRSLPLCVDEMTNITPDEISDFVYQVSQGRERSRLSSEAILKTDNPWNTIVISSSNASVISRLMHGKADSRAETMRVWEIPVEVYSTHAELDAVNGTVRTNYGRLGRQFIDYLVRNEASVRTMIGIIRARLRAEWRITTQERFWEAFAVLVIASATILRVMGIAEFNINTLRKGLLDGISHMREAATGVEVIISDVLARYLSDTVAERVIFELPVRPHTVIPMPPHLRALTSRYDATAEILTISEAHFCDWLERKKGPPYIDLLRTWGQAGFKPTRGRRNIGAGIQGAWASISVVMLKVPKMYVQIVPTSEAQNEVVEN